jgi:hypothetical protein
MLRMTAKIKTVKVLTSKAGTEYLRMDVDREQWQGETLVRVDHFRDISVFSYKHRDFVAEIKALDEGQTLELLIHVEPKTWLENGRERHGVNMILRDMLLETGGEEPMLEPEDLAS